MRAFASDNYAPALPEVLEAIGAANTGHVVSYGADPVTARLAERVREHFGADATGFPVFNGTAANVVGLRAMLRPWQGVICAESAHLNVDEGGAPEALAGWDFGHFLIQPMDCAEAEAARAAAIDYVLHHPRWRLSLQTHKLLGLP